MPSVAVKSRDARVSCLTLVRNCLFVKLNPCPIQASSAYLVAIPSETVSTLYEAHVLC
jgi:hypothetical protein